MFGTGIIRIAAMAAQRAIERKPDARISKIKTKAMTISQINTSRVAHLHPLLQQKALQLIKLCAQAGFSILITQGLRTWAEQEAIYAQGRVSLAQVNALRKKAGLSPIVPKENRIVSNASAGKSWHNYGLAFDFVVLDALQKADWNSSHPQWAKAGALGTSIGLFWGGNFKKSKDMPHFEMTGNLKLAEARALFAKGGLPEVWKRIA